MSGEPLALLPIEPRCPVPAQSAPCCQMEALRQDSLGTEAERGSGADPVPTHKEQVSSQAVPQSLGWSSGSHFGHRGGVQDEERSTRALGETVGERLAGAQL